MTVNIIVVGGSGFIGSVLTRRLSAKGHQVTVYDIAEPNDKSVRYVKGDIRNQDDLASALRGQHLVINLAAEHQDNVFPINRYDSVNVEGGRVLTEAMAKSGVTALIFTSSVAVYGVHARPITEDFAHGYFNDYGRTKHEAEAVYKDWQAGDPSRSLTIIRPTVVFGPGNRGNVYNLLRQIKSGRFLMVGNGRNHKSIAYVENVAGFIEHVADGTVGVRTFNYADQPDLSMNDLVARIQTILGKPSSPIIRLPYTVGLAIGLSADIVSRLTGRTFPISAIRVKKFCMDSQVDASRAFMTGYCPSVDVWEGLDDMVRNHV